MNILFQTFIFNQRTGRVRSEVVFCIITSLFRITEILEDDDDDEEEDFEDEFELDDADPYVSFDNL